MGDGSNDADVEDAQGTSDAGLATRTADADLILGHGADAPNPDDPAEPSDLPAQLAELMKARFTRRKMLTRGVQGAGVVAVAGAMGGALAGPAAAHPFDPFGDADAINGAIDVTYLEDVTRTLASLGDTADGWRPGGSPANLQAVEWIASEMRRVGMRHVAKLPVPIDRWVFNGASVAVDGGPVFNASSWGGVPGTAPGGITAEVIDIGLGYDADYDGIDATGKIVLVNWAFGDFWVNRHGHEATLQGALAVIFYTGTTAAGAFYNARDDGLMSFDGTYDDDWVPFVFVTRDSANDLRARIAGGPTQATLTSNVELTRAADGGVGYNVLGAIPGTDRADEYIIFTGHHDAWFHGAADDSTAIAAMLGIAKAIKTTGFRPRRTLLFLASTNEEYGYTDAYYEWLVGCWYAVTHQRTDWQRRAVLTLDFELLGTGDPGERLLIRTHSELLDLAVAKLESDPSRTPFGTSWQNVVWANADHFTLTAAGIPGLYFNTVGLSYLTRNYHTNFDVIENVNFPYLAQNIEVINDIWVEHDRSTLPLLDFVARATEAESRIAFIVDGVDIRSLPGLDPAKQDALEAAVARFREAAEAWDAQAESGNVRSRRRIAKLLMSAERTILTNLVALDVFDQYVFPHQQAQRDATRMQAAVDALAAGDPATALSSIQRTGLTNAGQRFAYETYVAELARHDQAYPSLQWGGQAHLATYVDLWHEFHAVTDKIADGKTAPADYADEISSIQGKLDGVYGLLNERLGQMADVFQRSSRSLVGALVLCGHHHR